MHRVFMAVGTEFEAGWGSRPDGIIFGQSLFLLKQAIKRNEERGSYEEFTRFDKIKVSFVNDEGLKMIDAETGVAWVGNSVWHTIYEKVETKSVALTAVEIKAIRDALYYHYDGVEGEPNREQDAFNKALANFLEHV